MRQLSCFTLVLWMLFHMSICRANDTLELGLKAFNEKQFILAAYFWRPLAEQGNVEAQMFMGVLYRYGLGVDKSPKDSAYWYEQAANQGDVDAQGEIAFFYERGFGVEKNDAVAESWYQMVREHGYCLGDTLPTGRLIVDDSLK